VYVVQPRIMSNTLTEFTAKLTGDYQNGFQTNWGTIDNMHILRQVI